MAHRTHDDAERARPAGGERSVGSRDLSADRISEEPGASPVGTGVGAAGEGVASAGLGGAIGGPSGAVIGGAIDAIGGGSAGRRAAEVVNPTEEEAYWRETFLSRPYADETLGYDHYRPAYRYGWESRARYPDRRWDQVERELESGWRENRGSSRLGWTDAKLAARDAWQRVDRRMLDQRERDRLHDERIASEDGADRTAGAGAGSPA
jgi:hypothetical protein